MALSNKARKDIDTAIKRFVAYIRFRSIGPHALTKPELKDLARSGMVTGIPSTAAVLEAYHKTHFQAVNGDIAPKNIRDGALEFLERMFRTYTDKLGEQIKSDVIGTVESNLMPFRDRAEAGHIYDALKDKPYGKNLANTLKDKVDNWQNRWKTIVRTELNRASNWGSMDAILTNNKDKEPHEILVYKQGPHDGATCDFCLKFWYLTDGKTPRVYKMSELMANGSNIGRKQKDWKPTIDSTHPNERHILHELPPEWGFDKSGDLDYIGPDHNEWKFQRGG